MTNEGNRDADVALAVTDAAKCGQAAQRVANVFALIPPSSLLSAFITSDSATVKEYDIFNTSVFHGRNSITSFLLIWF